MKLIKDIIISLSLLFGIILLIGFLIAVLEIIKTDWDFSTKGIEFFVERFSTLGKIFTVTIALLSTYFIMFQIENISKSNKRTETILNNEITNKTLEQSKIFYTELQPKIRETYIIIHNRSSTLLSLEWNFSEFNDHSVNEQHPEWEHEYEKLIQAVKDKIIEILNIFESLSAIILHGNIDKQLAYNLFGVPFVKNIETWYPLISAYRSRNKKEDEEYYNSVVKLYNDWKLKENKT